MLIDLHAHTCVHSMDASHNPDELIEAAKAAGLHGICLTEHDQFWDAGAVRELSRRHNFLIIPGSEINTEDGHMLVFGLERYVFGMHRAAFLRALVDEANGAMLAAHPYRRRLRTEVGDWVPPYEKQIEAASREEAFTLVHGLEAFNGRGSPVQNQFSLDLSEYKGLPSFAASDAHDPKDVGACATEFSRHITDVESFVQKVQAGRFKAVKMREKKA